MVTGNFNRLIVAVTVFHTPFIIYQAVDKAFFFFSLWLNETHCSNERNPFPQLETAKQSNPVSASAKQRGRMDSLQSSPSSAEHTRCGVAALTDVLAWLSWNSHVVAMVQVKPI